MKHFDQNIAVVQNIGFGQHYVSDNWIFCQKHRFIENAQFDQHYMSWTIGYLGQNINLLEKSGLSKTHVLNNPNIFTNQLFLTKYWSGQSIVIQTNTLNKPIVTNKLILWTNSLCWTKYCIEQFLMYQTK